MRQSWAEADKRKLLRAFHAPPVVGTAINGGRLIVCQIAKAERGLARIELGRSQFRHASRPSFLPYVASSLSYLVVPEAPLYVNLSALMGLARFDSDDDDESSFRQVYSFNWRPQASQRRLCAYRWDVEILLCYAVRISLPYDALSFINN